MIQRKPQNRLGFNGPDEVKSHPWLADFPWGALMRKELESPFIPPVQKAGVHAYNMIFFFFSIVQPR